jgi:leader peptidase (prepilin peptidase)/N-methyltransferase
LNAIMEPLGAWLPGLSGTGAREVLRLLACAGFLGVLAWLSIVDMRIRRLPDRIVLPTLWAGLTLNAAFSLTAAPAEAVLGAAGGYAALRALGAAWSLRRPDAAFGGGDLKMAAMIGGWTGASALPVVLGVAFVAGSLAAMPMLLAGRCGLTDEVPFGPALALGGLAALLGGPEISALLFGPG